MINTSSSWSVVLFVLLVRFLIVFDSELIVCSTSAPVTTTRRAAVLVRVSNSLPVEHNTAMVNNSNNSNKSHHLHHHRTSTKKHKKFGTTTIRMINSTVNNPTAINMTATTTRTMNVKASSTDVVVGTGAPRNLFSTVYAIKNDEENYFDLEEKVNMFVNRNFELFAKNNPLSSADSMSTTTAPHQSIHAGSLTNHYQVITICNTLPSILKCQNRQHFLIIYKILYGINDLKYQNECSPNSKCTQVDDKEEHNCTGSNICVFYPTDRFLTKCNLIKSNLTQIQIACVNLAHLKKYYTQRNKNFDPKMFDQKFKEAKENNKLNTSSGKKFNVTYTNLNIDYLKKRFNGSNYTNASNNNFVGNENRLKNVDFEYSNSSQNSVIAISLITFFSLLAVILISLIYYRLKIKQLISTSALGMTDNRITSTAMTASRRSYSNSGIYEINSSSMKNLPPPPPGFNDNASCSNTSQSLDYQNVNPTATGSNIIVQQTIPTPTATSTPNTKSTSALVRDYFRDSFTNLNENFTIRLNNIKKLFSVYSNNLMSQSTASGTMKTAQPGASTKSRTSTMGKSNNETNKQTESSASDYYPSPNASKCDNKFYLNNDDDCQSIASSTNEKPVATNNKTASKSNEIYANMSVKSKSNPNGNNTYVYSKWSSTNRTATPPKLANLNKLMAAELTSKELKCLKKISSDYYQIIINSAANSQSATEPVRSTSSLKSNKSTSKAKSTSEEKIYRTYENTNPNPTMTEFEKSYTSIDQSSGNDLDYNMSTTSSNITLSSSSLSSSTSNNNNNQNSKNSNDASSSNSLTSNNDQLYYQRSSVGGFNFTYMLYDIPEEEDEAEPTTSHTADSNTEEILKI